MENTRFKISQYACAVLLIVSSIALVAYRQNSLKKVAKMFGSLEIILYLCSVFER